MKLLIWTNNVTSSSRRANLYSRILYIAYRPITTSEWKKYLSILEVNANSNKKDIKDNFLRLSKIYHPDNKLTGSHAKFLELKEAYDALKDGQPTSTSSYTSETNSYNNQQNSYSHKDYVRYHGGNQRYRDEGRQGNYNAGDRAWDNYVRQRNYQKAKAERQSFGKGKPDRGLSVLSGLAWIFIYSAVMFGWAQQEKSVRRDEDFVAYSEYVRRREERLRNRDENWQADGQNISNKARQVYTKSLSKNESKQFDWTDPDGKTGSQNVGDDGKRPQFDESLEFIQR